MKQKKHIRKVFTVITKENIISLGETYIHCRIIGKGPSLVVLHGRFQNNTDYQKLCQKLSHWFTVYGINRDNQGHTKVQGWITICKKTG